MDIVKDWVAPIFGEALVVAKSDVETSWAHARILSAASDIVLCLLAEWLHVMWSDPAQVLQAQRLAKRAPFSSSTRFSSDGELSSTLRRSCCRRRWHDLTSFCLFVVCYVHSLFPGLPGLLRTIACERDDRVICDTVAGTLSPLVHSIRELSRCCFLLSCFVLYHDN